MKGQINAQ